MSPTFRFLLRLRQLAESGVKVSRCNRGILEAGASLTPDLRRHNDQVLDCAEPSCTFNAFMKLTEAGCSRESLPYFVTRITPRLMSDLPPARVDMYHAMHVSPLLPLIPGMPRKVCSYPGKGGDNMVMWVDSVLLLS